MPCMPYYSPRKNIRSSVCLYILSYMHDIAILTKDLCSGYQELKLWFFALIDLWVTSRGNSEASCWKIVFSEFTTKLSSTNCSIKIIPRGFRAQLGYNGKSHWKTVKYSGASTQMRYIKSHFIYFKFQEEQILVLYQILDDINTIKDI